MCRSNRYLRCTYIGKRENLNIKAVTTIDPVTGWFKIMKYDYKRAITINNILETTCG